MAIQAGLCTVHMQVAIGATGAPTLSAVNSPGVKSITRNGAGDYSIIFGDSTTGSVDTYNAVRWWDFKLTDTTARDFTGQTHTESAIGTTGTIRVLFLTAGVATELPNGATLKLAFDLKNSSVV